MQLIYRTGVVTPFGAALVDLDPIHNRPPTSQTFDVVAGNNAAFGKRFTVIANHFKSKGCSGATGADADINDGQGCFSDRRTQQSARLLSWIAATVVPAAGNADVLLLGDFNSYGKETPVTTLTSGGYTDLAGTLLGPNSYSYLFNGELGHLDYAFASASLASKITGVGNWHINADEADVLDYNDEIKDVGEATFEAKPDGSSLTPPRVMYQAGTPYRASDHDPVLVGLFAAPSGSVLNVDNSDAATTYDATTDGVLLLRYLLGYRNDELIANARGTGASLRDATQIAAHIAANLSFFDVDGDGQTLALTDGLMILRRLLNPTASPTDSVATASITANAKNSTRSDEGVVRAIDLLKP